MAKAQTRYRCPECGHETAQWFAKCPNVRECGRFVEAQEVTPQADRKGRAGKDSAPGALFRTFGEISRDAVKRIPTDIPELDRVLGGGLVPDSFIMLAGEPGAGKSTLAAELCLRLSARSLKVAYVSGEESDQQVKSRFDRLAPAIAGADPNRTPFSKETSVERVCASIRAEQLDVIVVDSVQTMISEEVSGAPGGVSQVRECAHHLMQAAKTNGTVVVLIGQVIKGGDMAGPKTLEHLVDVILQFESVRQDQGGPRVLRAHKNRFGSTEEIGVFKMTATGLQGVPNPSEMFAPKRDRAVPGTVTCAVMEGSRPVLVEVQALVNTNDKSPMPTRVVNGIDPKRLQMMLAIMSRKLGYPLGSMDVFVNVGGGLKVSETAIDLGVCVALASAVRRQPARDQLCVFGEVNLIGEVQPAPQADRRANEAERLGYTLLPHQDTLREMLAAALSGTVVEEGLDGELVPVGA